MIERIVRKEGVGKLIRDSVGCMCIYHRQGLVNALNSRMEHPSAWLW